MEAIARREATPSSDRRGRRFHSPDDLIWRYRELAERLYAPRTGSGVLHSGIMLAGACEHCGHERSEVRREGRGVSATYQLACSGCGRPWPAPMADLRRNEIGRQRGGMRDEPAAFGLLAELGTMSRILAAVARRTADRPEALWEARVWQMWVLRKEVHGGFSWEELPERAAREWRRRFSEWTCRRLVSAARADAEARLRRAGMWAEA